MDKFVTSSMFKGKYLKNIPADFEWQKTPVQIYPLSLLRDHFKLPLPAIRTDYNFLFYIREGSFERHIDGDLYHCKADSLVFVSLGMVSSLLSISDNLNGFFVLIEESTMFELFNQQQLLNVFMIDPILNLKVEESEWMNIICELLYNELRIPLPDMQVSNNLTRALFSKILNLSKNKRNINRTQQIAIQFKQLVHQHFVHQKRTSFYAEVLAISPNYLNRCVKSVFNKSCKELILEVAILNSQILLVDNTKSIAEVSFELQFDDPSYFSRLFKNFTGKTPSEYRLEVMHD